MDLFTPENPNAETEQALADAMRAQWLADKATIKAQRRYADWMGEPKPLSRDKAALLEYLYEHGAFYWTQSASAHNLKAVAVFGYNDSPKATINARATLDAMVKAGLIEVRARGDKLEYSMTQEGEFALADWQLERELGFL
jgi:hypothetical protein